MSSAGESLLLCPQCRQPLPQRPPCDCGFVLRESHGILQLIADEDLEAQKEFLEAYERVRKGEGWGGDDLDLPFNPKRHRDIWAIRRRTFQKFESVAANVSRGFALDIGAGNCWMTRYLDRWGFDAIAVDLFTNEFDGLRAGQKFIDEGARFLRICAQMERLPFASERIRLIAANASFHYSRNFRATLSEFERVLTPGGIIAIVDSPFYESAADGDRMLAGRVVEFRQKYGMTEALARRSGYLIFQDLEELARSLKLTIRWHPVWPGVSRNLEQIRARLAGVRIARFPVVVLEKS